MSLASTLHVARWPGSRQPPPGFTWAHVSASPALAVTTVDHGDVSLLWMDPSLLRFRYVPGSRWPENGPVAAADTVPATWTARMVAAFNGGFKLFDHVGGYYYLGDTVAPLRSGYAAFVVRRDGTLSVGVWGRDLHLTSDAVVVRQNLPPIVADGLSQAKATDPVYKWGLTLQHLRAVNRSALGQLADGGLVFEYGHLVTPQTIVTYLVKAGAQTAMMLDTNVVWPTGFLYTHAHGQLHGTKINSHIKRTPWVYLTQYQKDFVAVQSR